MSLEKRFLGTHPSEDYTGATSPVLPFVTINDDFALAFGPISVNEFSGLGEVELREGRPGCNHSHPLSAGRRKIGPPEYTGGCDCLGRKAAVAIPKEECFGRVGTDGFQSRGVETFRRYWR